MPDYFLGEIRAFAHNSIPTDFLPCDGRLVAISLNPALFAVLGVSFGGNGVSNFALPDLRGVAPVGVGFGFGLTNRVLGDRGGVETVTLSVAQLPSHSHALNAATGAATDAHPTGNLLAEAADVYAQPSAPATMVALSATPAAAHENRPPCMYVTACICVNGTFP